jgi:hypothetical protein
LHCFIALQAAAVVAVEVVAVVAVEVGLDTTMNS